MKSDLNINLLSLDNPRKSKSAGFSDDLKAKSVSANPSFRSDRDPCVPRILFAHSSGSAAELRGAGRVLSVALRACDWSVAPRSLCNPCIGPPADWRQAAPFPAGARWNPTYGSLLLVPPTGFSGTKLLFCARALQSCSWSFPTTISPPSNQRPSPVH